MLLVIQEKISRPPFLLGKEGMYCAKMSYRRIYVLLMIVVHFILCSDTNYMQSNCSDGDVRLEGGSDEYEGRVEICINQVWGTICSGSSYSRWGVTDGRVVCKQLGHQEFGKSELNSANLRITS